MIEVERKYRVTREEAESIALQVGADGGRRQVDEIYLLKSESWQTFTSGEPVLRLRKSGEQVSLTVKTRKPGGTTESEVAVPDLPSVQALVRHLGATPVTMVEKTRRLAFYKGTTVAIDHVDGLGDFVELEVVVTGPDGADDALASIYASARDLGLRPNRIEPDKYDTLVERAKGEGRPPRTGRLHTAMRP